MLPRFPSERGVPVPVRITNRSRGLLTIELNSGTSLHLAPGETSGALEELEVDGNRWVQKLLDGDEVKVDQADRPKPKPRGTRRSGRGSPKR
jgi:hypothetical protein